MVEKELELILEEGGDTETQDAVFEFAFDLQRFVDDSDSDSDSDSDTDKGQSDEKGSQGLELSVAVFMGYILRPFAHSHEKKYYDVREEV